MQGLQRQVEHLEAQIPAEYQRQVHKTVDLIRKRDRLSEDNAHLRDQIYDLNRECAWLQTACDRNDEVTQREHESVQYWQDEQATKYTTH